MLIKTRDCNVTIPALLFDRGFFVFDFNARNGLTKFLLVEEAMLERSPFVDIRFEPLAQAQFWVSSKELFALEGRHDIQRPAPVFIFHHAFVCSTLVARCLNQIDAFFSLKEPWILRRLADHRRGLGHAASSPAWREMLVKYVMLLCRNFTSGRVPLIKATNVANNLLADVLELMPDRQILYLYSDLESFLVSNLKKPAATQEKMPALAKAFLADGDLAQRFPHMTDLSRGSFLQVCALIWLASLYHFKNALAGHANARVKTLDSRDLLHDLPASLTALSRFFGHAPDAGEVQRMLDPQVIRTNAKDPSMPYGHEQRQMETRQIRSRHDQELASAVAWITPLVRELGVVDFMHSHRLMA